MSNSSDRFTDVQPPISLALGIFGLLVGLCIAPIFWIIFEYQIRKFLYWICPCIRRLQDPSQPELALQAHITPQPQGNVRRQRIGRMYNTPADSQGDSSESRTPPIVLEDEMTATPSGGATPGSTGAQSSYSNNNTNMVLDQVHVDVDAEGSADVDAEGSASSVPAEVTMYIPDGTSESVVTNVVTNVDDFIQPIALGDVHRWMGSIVIQAMVSIDSSTLVKLEEFAKKCSGEVEGFYLQIAEWGIFFRSGGSFQLYRLKEGEVPEIFDIVWQSNSGFVVRGFYLNGSNIKEATEQSSSTLRTAGPPSQICGLLEELSVSTEGQDVGKSLIIASRVINVNGLELTVRSRAMHAVPSVPKSFKERSRDGLLKILHFDTMKKALLRFQVRQPKIAQRREILEKQLDVDAKSISELKTKLLVEHWKGVSESEMLDFRKKVLHYLQQLPSSEIDNCTDPCPSHFVTRISSCDREYWKGGLHDLNEVIEWNTDTSQSSILFRVRGRTKLFLGEFESALQDFDLADESLNIDGLPSSTAVLERAIVKCALARYPEAMQDVIAAAAINRNLIDVKKLQTCLKQILVTQDITVCANTVHETVLQQPQLSDDLKHVQGVSDLLTGDKWSSDHQLPTSNHSVFFSARILSLKNMMIDSTNSLNPWEFKIEASKAHWSELVEHEEWSEVDGAEEMHQDEVLLKGIHITHDYMMDFLWPSNQRLSTMPKEMRNYLKLGMPKEMRTYLKLGRKIAEGGQAEIFEVEGWPGVQNDLVAKVFKLQVTTMAQLQKQFRQLEAASLPGASPAICKALGAILLEDNRFALVFPRYWGDLRTLIDQQMMNKPLDQLTSPLDIKTSLDIMLQIAVGIMELHAKGIVHRDLKAANVLINTVRIDQKWDQCKVADFGRSLEVNTDCIDQNRFHCYVADFECSVGVVGTGFWRAPEILQACRDRNSLKPELWTKSCDVYSYGMTCYEILTGKIPFEDLPRCAYDTVLSGCRPSLPSALHSRLTGLIEHCWHTDPERRPSFLTICLELRYIRQAYIVERRYRGNHWSLTRF